MPLTGVIVGAGFFAEIQAEAWSRLPEANIAAVVDPDLAKANEFAAKWNIPKVYADTAEMLASENPDFVDIVTRPETHLQLVQQIAAHRCDIICQKPMAPTLVECEQMVRSCEQAGVRLLIHENWRWQPWYREIKQLYKQHQLGEIFQLSFQVRTGDGFGDDAYTVQPYFRQMQRLLIYETLVHHIDTTRFLAGEIAKVSCQTQQINSEIAGEDYANIQLRLATGGLAVIDANRINGPVPAPMVFGTVLLEAEQGAIRLDSDGSLWLTHYGEQEKQHRYEWQNRGYRGDSVYATQKHLIESLIQGTPAETEAAEYMNTVKIVEDCYASANH